MTGPSKTAKRAAAIAIAMALALVPVGPAISAPDADGVIAQGAALAAAAVSIANVDPDVDLWPLYSESSIDNESSHGLSGALWPGFLLDAFAWLYGLQPQERAGLGISESQWPNPPHSSRASSSGFMFESFVTGCATYFDPAQCAQAFAAVGEPPGALGVSESNSGALLSNGMARGAQFDIPGVLDTVEAWSRTNTRFENGRTIVESTFTARDITIGTDLHIDMIEARSTAIATGTADTSKGTSTLKILGARLGDTPVVIDSQGMHAAGDEGTDSLNEALAEQGLEVRASQGRQDVKSDGEFVDSATGGLLLRIFRERVEETFPEPLVSGKDDLCRAIDENLVSDEITRVQIDQANPLYGQIPITPERVQLEQSVPPPVGCPFLNRNFEVTLALGLTNASARLSPLPGLGLDLGLIPTIDSGGDGVAPDPIQLPVVAPSLSESRPDVLGTSEAADLVSSPVSDPDGARRVKIFYGVFVLLAALAIAGRFALRAISAP